MAIKVDAWLFMSKPVIYVTYLDGCLFSARSQSGIDKAFKYLKDDSPIYNWGKSKGEYVYELLGIDIKTSDNGRFQNLPKLIYSKGIRSYMNVEF